MDGHLLLYNWLKKWVWLFSFNEKILFNHKYNNIGGVALFSFENNPDIWKYIILATFRKYICEFFLWQKFLNTEWNNKNASYEISIKITVLFYFQA